MFLIAFALRSGSH